MSQLNFAFWPGATSDKWKCKAVNISKYVI